MLVIIAVAFAAIQLLDSSEGEAHVSLIDYTNEELGFSIKHPEGWLPTENNTEVMQLVSFDEQTDVNDTSDPYRSFPAQILVDIQQAPTPETELEADAFFDLIETNVEANLGQQDPEDFTAEYAELISKEEIEVDGYRAMRITVDIFNFESSPGENGHGVLVFVHVSPSKQVTLLYEGHSSDDDVYNDFHSVIDSFDLMDNS